MREFAHSVTRSLRAAICGTALLALSLSVLAVLPPGVEAQSGESQLQFSHSIGFRDYLNQNE
jgi:hypothetical protein